MPPRRGDDVARFWRYVDVHGMNECWPWLGATRGKGYGAFSVKTGSDPKQRRQIDAHRYAWQLHNCPIPEGMHVCHRCDNPPCCNPTHLFIGTAADNMRDKSDKGRNPGNRTHGRRPPFLNGDRLIEARAMLAAGSTQRAVADHFGISAASVCRGLAAVKFLNVAGIPA